jgi:hypothetical protein
MSITMRELEILATLKQHWARLYSEELLRLLRELNGPYLFRPRARPRRRLRGRAVLRRRKSRGMPTVRHNVMRGR